MSELRCEFYRAVDKANTYVPKKKIKKFIEQGPTVEEQISSLLNEADSAVSFIDDSVETEEVAKKVYEITKKDEETLAKELAEKKIWDEIEEKRKKARFEYRKMTKMMEKIAPSSAASTSPSAGAAGAAGAGAGSGGRKNKYISKYTEFGYFEEGYIE